MRTDRELLELAAKAAGYIPCATGCTYRHFEDGIFFNGGGRMETWNPLMDDGDALRLAVKLNLHVRPQFKEKTDFDTLDYVEVGITNPGFDGMGDHDITRVLALEEAAGDEFAATRRAIVRAAAEVGRQA